MTRTAKSIAAALLLTVAAGGAFAQTGYTRDTVAQADPFGTLPVDPQTFYVTEGSIAALGATAVAELNARCDVVVSWPSYYGWGTAAFCQNVLYAQGLIADQNAPDSSVSGWVTVNTISDGWVTVSSSD
jgi:hypothetical protein